MNSSSPILTLFTVQDIPDIDIDASSCFPMFKKQPSLPPGPKPLPIIGNARDMPKTRAYEKFAEWAKIYGSLSVQSHEPPRLTRPFRPNCTH